MDERVARPGHMPQESNGKTIRTAAVSAEPKPGTLVEMVYRPDEAQTAFAVWDGSAVRYEREFKIRKDQLLVPYSPMNNLIRNRVVLFPSDAGEYGSEEDLIADIQSFIHQYVDLSPLIEKIATYYVLFTWVYDAFQELPYFRFRGDYGSGKTRALLTVGSLCYKPIFASGASTVSPIFRMLDAFKGTLIVDESDFRVSDEKAEITKILNNGNARGFPVLRAEAYDKGKEFNPVAYSVFGPKILASRGSFQDRALESRFITEEMGHTRLRKDIPINLPSDHATEATRIRNKLLLFRFRTLQKGRPENVLVDRNLEPRLNQIFSPLLSIIRDRNAREDLKTLARSFQRDMAADRGMGMEAQVLEVIRTARGQGQGSRGVSVKAITTAFAKQYGGEYERKITPHWIGYLIRKKLGLKTEKQHGTYLIAASEGPKLEHLFDKYGVAETVTDSGDFGDSTVQDDGSGAVEDETSGALGATEVLGVGSQSKSPKSPESRGA